MGIVILSAAMPGQDALRSMRASVCGYVSKAASASQLAQAVEVAAAGRGHQSRATQTGLQQLAANRVCSEDLDVPERQVLVAIVEGLRNKEIADRLGIEKRTVETHRERIMRKLNIHSVAGLTRLAVAEGLVPLQ
jgi:two-component system, NarL family, nitrate/nitrite response regulator NarL